MDPILDLVGSSRVSVVLAQDRDGFAREPVWRYPLHREFEEHGVKLPTLNVG